MSGRYYRALSMMHQQAQKEIDSAGRSPQPDWVRIGQLKRLRLSIKDRMRSLKEHGRAAKSEASAARGVGRQSQPAWLGSEA